MNRVALHALQAGAILVMLAAVPNSEFELDRFYMPKELVLHVTALVAGLPLLSLARRFRFTIADILLAGWLLLGVASAFVAINGWLAFRVLAVSASSLVLFWSARHLVEAGHGRALAGGLAAAVVAGVASALVQAYGVTTDLFATNRAPGGTLGNRNSVAHVAAFGLPLLLLTALQARRWFGYLPAAVGTMVVVTGLVLTRSRAAWLAAAAVLLVLAVALLLSPALRRSRPALLRLAGIVVVAGAGVAAALLLPNALQWRSDSPYLDSLRGVAQYQEGSGAGRLLQYRRSMGIATAAPVLGAGPGNWAVAYPQHAASPDPSMSGSRPGMTSNPWPSSDWVAFITERGFAGAALLLGAWLALLVAAVRRLRSPPPEHTMDLVVPLAAAALPGLLAGALVTGALDAVLILPHAALVAWTGLGLLYATLLPPSPDPAEPAGDRRLTARARQAAVAALLLLCAFGAARSAAQVAAIQLHEQGSTSALRTAARLDPGNFRIRLALARPAAGLPREQRCRHAQAAHRLFPSAREARNLSRACS